MNLLVDTHVFSIVEKQIQTNEFKLLQIKNEHFWQLAHLPRIHKDPFDRLLVSQAQSEHLSFITYDSKLSGYGSLSLYERHDPPSPVYEGIGS